MQGKQVGRNRYCLTIEVDLTLPVPMPHAQSAADLLASDVWKYLQSVEWGWGQARIESVYAPTKQFEHGDFVPGEGGES